MQYLNTLIICKQALGEGSSPQENHRVHRAAPPSSLARRNPKGTFTRNHGADKKKKTAALDLLRVLGCMVPIAKIPDASFTPF